METTEKWKYDSTDPSVIYYKGTKMNYVKVPSGQRIYEKDISAGEQYDLPFSD